MYTAMVIIDVLLALLLIALVLLQQGKGADAGAAFGSGSSGTVFGAAGGASMMQKVTTWVAVGFFAVTLGLSVIAKDRIGSAVKQAKPTSVVGDIVPEEEETVAPPPGFIPEADVQPDGVDAIPDVEAPQTELPAPTDPADAPEPADAPTVPE